ncbi:MAG: carbohydrate ABC transporter permease [Clostridia bacterium]|nr:carbohydrate ABC transporter permease [Clostridia bacterium]
MVKSKNDLVFNILVYAIMLFVLLVTLIPVLFVVSMSFTPYAELIKNNGFVLIPRSFTLYAYHEMLQDGKLVHSMGITVKVTIIGTLSNLIVTLLTAYPLSRRQMPGQKMLMRLIIFTMVFTAGTVPTYMVVKNLGLINTAEALYIPSMISVFNLIIMKAFFEGLPDELFEAARIDGASEFGVLVRIVMPMSLPILMTIGMYYAVGHWNTYTAAILYINKADLYPLQVVLRDKIRATNANVLSEEVVPPETMKMAAVCFATAPIVVVYPFIQKYFVKGTLAGAVKG